ncbi:hypothetical protein JCM10212_002060 [Sporobolomyces blumeae]
MPSALESPWGRLLIAGGTDFATLGRKDKSNKNFVDPEKPELYGAHIFRNVANVKFKRVFTSHSGCHAIALTLNDEAYLLGRNEHYQLSHPLPSTLTTSHLTSDVIPSPTPAALHPFRLRDLSDENAPPALKSQGIVHAAAGRGHTVLVTDKGEAWTAGWNAYGQCGHDDEHVSSFKRVKGDLVHEKVVQASCGIAHSLFLTASGRVYAVGTGEKGVLGNGKTGEHIAASRVLFIEQREPLLVEGAIQGRKIVQITSGQQHNMALDNEGYVYAWGFGGLGRLGLGAQMDVLSPVQVPAFAGQNVITRCRKVAAGSTNTLFLDNQGMILLCGKWKTSGDGSVGQPWMNPRPVQDIMGYKWEIISSGGVTLFCHAQDPKEGDFTVAWGQNAHYGELALGPGSAKSSTKPTRIEYLDGIEMLDIAAGQNTTFFVARPPPTEAAKEEAKALESVPMPPTAAAAAAPTPAPAESAPADAAPAASSAYKPSIDLSGFGFAFGAPPPPSTTDSPGPDSKAASPRGGGGGGTPGAAASSSTEDERKRNAVGISRTVQAAWEELPRYPAVKPEEYDDRCKVCKKIENESKGDSLECEKCEAAYHLGCLDPPLSDVPDGEWFCPKCDPEKALETPSGDTRKRRKVDDDDDEDDGGDEHDAKKRK